LCSINWGLLSEVITAVATVVLAVGGSIAAFYAYRAAWAANQTLRLESEPVLMVRIEEQTAEGLHMRLYEHDGHLLLRGVMRQLDSMRGTLYLSIENLGRSPAMNVTGYISFTPIEQGPAPTEFPWYVRNLIPGQRAFFAVRNETMCVVSVSVGRATRASIANGGKIEEAQLYAEAALPYTLDLSAASSQHSDAPDF
jgi:hypothetical protein